MPVFNSKEIMHLLKRYPYSPLEIASASPSTTKPMSSGKIPGQMKLAPQWHMHYGMDNLPSWLKPENQQRSLASH